MKSIKVCEYSRSRSFHDDLILQDQASGEHSQDQWSSGFLLLHSAGHGDAGLIIETPFVVTVVLIIMREKLSPNFWDFFITFRSSD